MADRQSRSSAGLSSDDASYLKRIRSGDADAFEEFVRAHSGAVLSVAQRILRNEADAADAVQDAFLAFFKSVDRFRGDARLSTWLHRIVTNAALLKLRSRSRRPERSLDDLLPKYYPDGHRIDPRPAWEATPEELLQSRESREMVHEKIAQLPENYRNLLILRDIQGLSTSQAARQLGESEGNVKTKLHRARQALRKLLEEELV